VDRISGAQVVLDILNDEIDEVIAVVEKHGDEKIANLRFSVLV